MLEGGEWGQLDNIYQSHDFSLAYDSLAARVDKMFDIFRTPPHLRKSQIRIWFQQIRKLPAQINIEPAKNIIVFEIIILVHKLIAGMN